MGLEPQQRGQESAPSQQHAPESKAGDQQGPALLQAEPEWCWQLVARLKIFLVVCPGGGAPQVTADKAVVVLY
jgi:hypothetical protein